MELETSEFELIRDLVYKKTGMAFDNRKLSFVQSRVIRRATEVGCPSAIEYYRLLKFEDVNEADLQQLTEALTTNETYFFREYPQLACFANNVLPDLTARRQAAGQSNLSIWSAACSTGDEPYPVALHPTSARKPLNTQGFNMSNSIQDILDDLSSDDVDTRRYAAEDLGDAGDPAAADSLAALLQDPSTAVREAAVDALSAIGTEVVVKAVIGDLRSENVAVRNAACEVLQAAGEDAVMPLCELVSDSDKDVRKFAVDTLMPMRDARCREALITALDDDDVNVAAAAAEALAEIGEANVVDELARLVGQDTEAWMRCAVARGLAKIGDSRCAELLNRMTDADDAMVRAIATRCLESLTHPAS